MAPAYYSRVAGARAVAARAPPTCLLFRCCSHPRSRCHVPGRVHCADAWRQLLWWVHAAASAGRLAWRQLSTCADVSSAAPPLALPALTAADVSLCLSLSPASPNLARLRWWFRWRDMRTVRCRNLQRWRVGSHATTQLHCVPSRKLDQRSRSDIERRLQRCEAADGSGPATCMPRLRLPRSTSLIVRRPLASFPASGPQ